ncbi:MAG TPA: metal-dependent hydrolase [Vicinamibacterales bacterium]|nr:metal-dependent hydrolase [Vicinamibacterales bacterium]
MPSPVGHALGGLIVALALAPDPRPHEVREVHEGHEGHEGHEARQNDALRVHRAWLPVVAWCALAACLPDVDFAWGRHNMETHSVGFALGLGAATLAWRRSARVGLAGTLAVGTHVLFDWLGSDDSPPLGVMALWPFSSEFFFADVWLFAAISRRYWQPWFIEQNTLAILRELAILLPIVVATWWLAGHAQSTKGTKIN